MQPLYRTTTIITSEEYKKLNKAAMPEQFKFVFIIYFALLFIEIINKNWWFIPLTLLIFIGTFLYSFYRIKKEYRTNQSLQHQKINYEFYDTFFLAEIAGATTKVYYNELNLIKETKSNFYLSHAKKIVYIVIKDNCSSDLISFLQNPELLRTPSVQDALFDDPDAVTSPCSAYDAPLYETTTLFTAKEQDKLQRYVVNKKLKLPYIFFTLLIILIAIIIYTKNFSWIIPILVAASGLSVGIWGKKEKNPFIQVEEQLFHYRFYTDYIQMETPLGITNYKYNDLYDIFETETNFYLQISSSQHIILVKENCSVELKEYIRKLSFSIPQQQNRKRQLHF